MVQLEEKVREKIISKKSIIFICENLFPQTPVVEQEKSHLTNNYSLNPHQACVNFFVCMICISRSNRLTQKKKSFELFPLTTINRHGHSCSCQYFPFHFIVLHVDLDSCKVMFKLDIIYSKSVNIMHLSFSVFRLDPSI